jgi:sn-glycerol 3-phosphate transport system substrate-binding protein
MRKKLLPLVAVLLVSVMLGACGGGEEGTPTPETPGAGPPAGPVTIEFWHSEVAANQEAISALADRFNASQDEVTVQPSFQGGYDDAMAKLIASLPTGNVPAIMFPGDTYMQTMIDSGAVAPIQDFVDQEDYDLSDLDEKGVQYYTSQGKLWAMPFTMEIPLLYYNKVTFREVGLDPEKPPQDLEELRQYSEKILKRDGAGNVVRSGIALEIGPTMERVLAEHGELFVDNENGRDGRATKVLFDNDTGRWLFQWWHDMVDEGLAFNAGRSPSATGAQGLPAVASGRAAMTIANAGALRSVIDVLEAGLQGVEVGISRLPGAPGSPDQTTYLTSYGLWVLNIRPKEEQEAAWTFVKWLMEPEQQAEWFAGSGYLPVSRSSVDLPAAQDAVARYPLFRQVLNLYLNAPATPATLTAALGPFQKVREAVYRGVEEMLSGVKGPDQALADAAAAANEAIKEYNERVGD